MTNDNVDEMRDAIEMYEHYTSIKADDLLAEYASMKVRDNRRDHIEAALEAAFYKRRDEMDDLMLVVQER